MDVRRTPLRWTSWELAEVATVAQLAAPRGQRSNLDARYKRQEANGRTRECGEQRRRERRREEERDNDGYHRALFKKSLRRVGET